MKPNSKVQGVPCVHGWAVSLQETAFRPALVWSRDRVRFFGILWLMGGWSPDHILCEPFVLLVVERDFYVQETDNLLYITVACIVEAMKKVIKLLRMEKENKKKQDKKHSCLPTSLGMTGFLFSLWEYIVHSLCLIDCFFLNMILPCDFQKLNDVWFLYFSVRSSTSQVVFDSYLVSASSSHRSPK